MFAALALAASLIVGPERVVPAHDGEPVTAPYTWDSSGTALGLANVGRDFAVVWCANQALWLQIIDGARGEPKEAGALRIAYANAGDELIRPAVASDGTTIAVVWCDQELPRPPFGKASMNVVFVRPDGTVTRRKFGADADTIYALQPFSITAVGDEYLAVWQSSRQTVAQFFSDDGSSLGEPFPVSASTGHLAVASNGSTALVVSGGDAFFITKGGSVAHREHLSDYDLGASATWNGSSYLVAYSSAPFSIAAFDGDGRLRRAPSTFSVYAGGSLGIDLVASAEGLIVFAPPYLAIRFNAEGTSMVDDFQLHLDGPLIHAASNGAGVLLVTDTGGALEFAYTLDVAAIPEPRPVAVRHETTTFAGGAGNQRLLFFATVNADHDTVARFDGETFLPELTPLPYGKLAMRGDDSGIALVAANEAFLVSDDGRASVPQTIHAPSSAPGSADPGDVAPIADRHVALWTNIHPTQIGGPIDAVMTYAATFDASGNVSQIFSGANLSSAALLPRGDSVMILYADATGSVSLVECNASGPVGAPWLLAPPSRNFVDSVAIAARDKDHALAIWPGNAVLLDLRTKTIVRRTTFEIRNGMSLVWNGDEFLALSGDLQLFELSTDGALIESQKISVPFGAYDGRITTSGAGTAIVYTRDAPDLGEPARRAFMRVIGGHAGHAGGRPREGSAPRP